jgi:3-oxoacyl-[acyl-carrier protein] reductase
MARRSSSTILASADAVVKEIGEDRAIAVQADVSKVADIKLLVEETVQKWGKIDILVNSAGIMPMMDLANTTEETYDRAMAVNVKGPYFLTQVDLRRRDVTYNRKRSNI